MEENEQYINALELQNKELLNKNLGLNTAAVNSNFFNQGQDRNLIIWQIDTEDILDKVEHFLKGDVIKTDSEGNVQYQAQKNKTMVTLNEYGVNAIMQILGQYINKDHILSFYDEERIYEILADIGDELADFVFENYDFMGMDTNFKKTRMKILVLSICHLIESTFRRAIRGKQMEEINTGRIITQSEGLGSDFSRGMGLDKPRRKFNLFKASTWG